MGSMSRRDFVKIGAQGVVLASLPLSFHFDPAQAYASPATGDASLTDYFEHFGVDETIIRRILATGMEKGGDYCDVFFQHSISNSLSLEDDVVNRASSSVSFGVGIRVLKGDQTGYSFTEEVTPEAMRLAAQTAAAIAQGGKNVPAQKLEAHQVENYYAIKTSWEEVGVDQKIPYLERVNARISKADPRVVRSRVAFMDGTSYTLFANSEGRVTYDYRPLTRLIGLCIAEKDGRREEGYYDFSARDGIEFYSEDKLKTVADEAVKRAMIQFEAVKPKAGEMPVVLAAGSSGILLHEAIGHGMEADCNRTNESIFSDKIGKKVAENFVSIVDNGTNPGLRGSINVDDEGNDSENTVLVEDGILKSYLHDRISSRFYKVKPTGSGRRESFQYPPLPRMRNTYMLNGPHTRDEIIASVKNGILCDSFTNGEVKIGPGDFTFYVKCGYLIENGKLTAPIKDINIIGNGPEVLAKVTMVADDFKMAQGGWTCGKSGQSVPVSMGLPTVKVSSITVGGVNS